jgi:hypothetical protein
MQRREFISLMGGAAAAWPLAARAQQPSMPVVGVLYTGLPEQSASTLAAFRQGLNARLCRGEHGVGTLGTRKFQIKFGRLKLLLSALPS